MESKQPTKSPKKPLTVIGLMVDGYKRLVTANITPPTKGLIQVRGKNAQGKTSLIGAMSETLGGVRAAADALPITEGQHASTVVIDLGEIIVRKHWTRDSAGAAKASLSITGADGGKISKPAAVLKELRGHFADPVAFLEMRPDDQVKTVLGVLGLAEELDKLSAIAATHFDTRTETKREVRRLAGALSELELEVGGLPAPPTEGTMEDCLEALSEAQEHNNQIGTLLTSMTGLEVQGKTAADRIVDLETDLELAIQHKVELSEKWREAMKAHAALNGPKPTEPLTLALVAHQGAARHQGRRDLLDGTRGDHEAILETLDACEEELAKAREKVEALLGGAEFPDPEMTYDNETKTLLLNGVPFSQASHAERLKAAAAVAMAGDPRIKVLFATDCSLLDDDSLAALSEMADAKGFQMWAEIVDSNAEGAGVWVSEGIATQCEEPSGESAVTKGLREAMEEQEEKDEHYEAQAQASAREYSVERDADGDEAKA